MTFKFVVTFALFAVCNAALLQTAQPAIYAAGHGNLERFAPVIYDFGYSVHDSHTGDIKSQQESRRGDVVRGQYSLVEPDGNRRIVDYSADEQNGFNAHVRRVGITGAALSQPASSAPSQAIVQQPVPLALAHQAPLLPQAPLAIAQHSAPLALAQHAPLALAHQAPLALSYQHSPLAFAHQAALPLGHQLPLQLAHHQSPLLYASQPAPLAYTHASHSSLAHQAAYAQQAASLAYTQTAPLAYAQAAPLAYSHLGLAPAPYAIAQTAPILQPAALAAPITHLASPYALQNHANLAHRP